MKFYTRATFPNPLLPFVASYFKSIMRDLVRFRNLIASGRITCIPVLYHSGSNANWVNIVCVSLGTQILKFRVESAIVFYSRYGFYGVDALQYLWADVYP